MTQKELLYVEDAIGHEDNMIAICQNSIDFLEDKKLIDFLEKEIKKHTTTRDQLMSMLEAKSNE